MQYLGSKGKVAKYIVEIINMKYQDGKSHIAKPIAETINRAGGA